jgi:methylenetetrahydrofolate--tRNA-(uracil-5-)-methyltransferase
LNFYRELIAAECAEVKGFEDDAVFSGCMPIEVMAKRGEDTMRFGPMKPVGIYDKNNKRPYAVLQLRRENGSGTMYNLVGFQTHLKFGEQKRVFSLIPALKNAEFLRYGVMHRNSFVDAPKVLDETFAVRLLRLRERWRTARNDYSPKEKGKTIYIAGQLSGVEGYVESAMSGLVAAKNLLNFLVGKPPFGPPATTMTGALCGYIAKENTNFQPMNSNFGLLPPLENDIKDKRKRKEEYSRRAIADMKEYLKEH